MVKLKDSQAERYVKAPDEGHRAVLVYGPDRGLVRERLDALARSVVDDLSDPFRVAEIAAAQLAKDPARLADEAAAMAFTGGRRVVRIREATDGIAAILDGFLAQPPGDALVLVEAGELPPRSSLRKLFEKAANGAAIPCYADAGASLSRVIRDTLAAEGLSVSADAVAYLSQHLGSDRLITRSELSKLALYKGGKGEVSLEDAAACVGDSAAFSLDAVAMAAASGDHGGLDGALARAYAEGEAPIRILRSVMRHFHRLHLVASLGATGMSPDQAMAKLRPPVFFKQAEAFKSQLGRWPPARLAQALDILTMAEEDCKVTVLPAEAVCARALLRLAQAARAGARQRR